MQTELFPLTTDEFVLPEKWYVKRTQENKELINQYFSELNRKKYTGPSTLMVLPYDFMHYPAFKGKKYPIGRTTFVFPRKDYTEITFEQFKKFVMKQDKAPLNWFIRGSKELESFLLTQKNKRAGINGSFRNAGYFTTDKGQWEWEFFDNLDMKNEISLEQYKEKVMKILGYKLKFPEYDKAAKKLAGAAKWCDNPNFNFGVEDTRTITIFKDVALLDVWFEPVYETIPELPVIKGKDGSNYHGGIDKDYIVYGCARLPIAWFSESFNRSITMFTLNSGVTISSEEVIAIKKYLNYHGLK